MAVAKIDLDGVVPYLGGRLRAWLGLEHGQDGRGRGGARGEGFFLSALVVAGGAGAIVAEIGEVEVAFVAVGPSDVHASACFYVDLYGRGFFAVVDGYGHLEEFSVVSSESSVNSLPLERFMMKSEIEERFIA